MTTMPMLSDFAIRQSGGLAWMLLIISKRDIPLAFFRTHCLVMLGLLVGASLGESRVVPSWILGFTIVSAFLAYLASTMWGLGLPRIASPLTGMIGAATLGLIGWSCFGHGTTLPVGSFDFASKLASAALLGSTLTAMLLGHHYLTSPAMSIEPLRKLVVLMAAALMLRTLLAAMAWIGSGWASSFHGSLVSPLFLGMRWGMGIFGPALATYLTWKTVAIRSTQSATGILYIAMTLVLFGELCGMILGRDSGWEF